MSKRSCNIMPIRFKNHHGENVLVRLFETIPEDKYTQIIEEFLYIVV